jgi:hypothetical protein
MEKVVHALKQSQKLMDLLQMRKKNNSIVKLPGDRYELYLSKYRKRRVESCFHWGPSFGKLLLTPVPVIVIVVRTKKLSCYAFSKIISLKLGTWLKSIGREAEWVRERLIAEMDSFALEQDANMKRLVKEYGEYQGQVHSLLVTFGSVEMQMIHIDMRFPNYQSVLYLTEGPPTHVFPVQCHLGLKTEEGVSVEQYVDWLLKELFDYQGAREALVSAIKSNSELEQFVRDYGILGAPMAVLKDAEHKVSGNACAEGEEEVFKGYCGFVGGWPHCGPSSAGFRAVMFSSYSPHGGEAYDAEFQVNPITLLTNVIASVDGVLVKAGAQIALEAMNALLLAKAAIDRLSHVRLANFNLATKDDKRWGKSDLVIHSAHALTKTFKAEASKCIAQKGKFLRNMKEKLPLPSKDKFQDYCGTLEAEKSIGKRKRSG